MIIKDHTLKHWLQRAQEECFAIPAFNIHNLETLQVVVSVSERMKSPVMLAATPGTLKYVGEEMLLAMGQVYKDKQTFVHYDHATTLPHLQRCIELGFPSVMIDASSKPFEENVLATKTVVDWARVKGTCVEAELGLLKGIEEDIVHEESIYTDPIMAKQFVELTGVDSLAVAIGTAHGFYKTTPKLDLDRLSAIRQLVSVPLVLHGASGLPDNLVKEAIRRGICKVNVATELKHAFSEGLKSYLLEHPTANDPRDYFALAKRNMEAVVERKIELCGSQNKR